MFSNGYEAKNARVWSTQGSQTFALDIVKCYSGFLFLFTFTAAGRQHVFILSFYLLYQQFFGLQRSFWISFS